MRILLDVIIKARFVKLRLVDGSPSLLVDLGLRDCGICGKCGDCGENYSMVVYLLLLSESQDEEDDYNSKENKTHDGPKVCLKKLRGIFVPARADLFCFDIANLAVFVVKNGEILFHKSVSNNEVVIINGRTKWLHPSCPSNKEDLICIVEQLMCPKLFSTIDCLGCFA